MTLLNEADAVYLGDEAVDAVYLGDVKVWPPQAAADVTFTAVAASGGPVGGAFDLTSDDAWSVGDLTATILDPNGIIAALGDDQHVSFMVKGAFGPSPVAVTNFIGSEIKQWVGTVQHITTSEPTTGMKLVEFQRPPREQPVLEWTIHATPAGQVSYQPGDIVSLNGKEYRCIKGGVAVAAQSPDAAATQDMWEERVGEDTTLSAPVTLVLGGNSGDVSTIDFKGRPVLYWGSSHEGRTQVSTMHSGDQLVLHEAGQPDVTLTATGNWSGSFGGFLYVDQLAPREMTLTGITIIRATP